MHKVRTRLWVLVMNSDHPRILRGADNPDEPDLPELVLQTKTHKLQDIMTDDPGRTSASSGGVRRSAMEYGSKRPDILT